MKRRTDIDIMLGTAMICVILGRILGTFLSNGIYQEYSQMSQGIYNVLDSFSISFLFVILGYVGQIVSVKKSKKEDFRTLIVTMLVPYLFFSAMQIILKSILGTQTLNVTSFLKVIIEPISGMWILLALFLIKLLQIELKETHTSEVFVGLLCLSAMLLTAVGIPFPGIIFYICEFGFCFFMGGYLYHHKIHGLQYLVVAIALVIGEILYFDWNEILGKTLVGISLFILVEGLFRKRMVSIKPLEFVGFYCMVFYIIDEFTNSPVINVLWKIGITNYWAVIVICMLVKLLIPVIIITIGKRWNFILGFFYPTKWPKVTLSKKVSKIAHIALKYIVLGLALISVLFTTVKLVKRAGDNEIKSYHVTESYVEQVETKESYCIDFQCVGKVMDSLQIEAGAHCGENGVVSYEIRDALGDILTSESVEIQSLEREDKEGLFIDVSKLDLQQGQFYSLCMDFSEVNGFRLVLGSGKLSIRQYFYSPYQRWYMLLIVALFVLACIWLWFAYKKQMDYKLFAMTLLFVGVVTAFAMPPANRDDEYRHFLRSYEEAMDDIEMIHEVPDGNENGIFGFAAGGVEPMVEVPYQIDQLRLMDSENNYNGHGYMQEVNNWLCLDKLIATSKVEETPERYRVSLNATGYRSAICYWPQILAMKLCSFLGSSCVWLYYIARIGQVIACVMLEALAIKIAPSIKPLIWLVAFIPNTILLQASCNSDGLLIAEIILLVAVVVWMKEKQIDIVSLKGVVGLVSFLMLSYSVVKMKVPYAIICLGAMIYLTKDNFGKALRFCKQYKRLVVSGLLGIFAMVVLGMFVFNDRVWELLYGFVPKAHVDFITANPDYIKTLFYDKWKEMIRQLYRSMKGSNRIPYPLMVVVLLLFMKKEQPIWKRGMFLFVSSIMTMVIVLVGYTLTPPDYGMIWGITFRYLLPFVSFVALCLPAGNENTQRIATSLVPLCIFVMVSQTLMSWLIGWRV